MQAVVTENLEEPTDVDFDEPAAEQPEIAEQPIETPPAASGEVQPEEPVQHVEEHAQPEPAAEQPQQPDDEDFSAEHEYIDEIMTRANESYEEMQEEEAAKEREEKGEDGDDKGE